MIANLQRLETNDSVIRIVFTTLYVLNVKLVRRARNASTIQTIENGRDD